MSLLKNIILTFPVDTSFSDDFVKIIGACVEPVPGGVYIKQTLDNSLPKLEIRFADVEQPTVDFAGENISISKIIVNETGQERTSPHTYKAIAIDEFKDRLTAAGGISGIDHIGMNFPWFDGLSPVISELRSKLAGSSAYYRFPSGEDWDFILPATQGEIESGVIDLNIERRPKVELVSFEKASTPIIQIDCITTIAYEQLKEMFPEAITDDTLGNLWVYIENKFGVDVCFILNGPSSEDWSNFFAGHRLQA